MAIFASTTLINNLTDKDGAGGAAILDAFDRWAVARGMRGRDLYDTVAKVMRYWVSFAMAKVPKGDAGKVREGLRRQIRTYSQIAARHTGSYTNLRSRKTHRGPGAAQADIYRGSVAAAIVAILNYKGANTLARARSPEFYKKAAEYERNRVYSVNHHRSGFMPAINVLGRGKGSDPGNGNVRMPKYRHPRGLIAHDFTDELAEILVENFASQSGNHPFRTKPDGIAGLAGDAFDKGLAEVVKMVGEFLYHDLANGAAEAGFVVTPRPSAMMAAPPMPLAA